MSDEAPDFQSILFDAEQLRVTGIQVAEKNPKVAALATILVDDYGASDLAYIFIGQMDNAIRELEEAYDAGQVTGAINTVKGLRTMLAEKGHDINKLLGVPLEEGCGDPACGCATAWKGDDA